MIPFGLISSLFDFATFFLMLYVIKLLNAPIEMFRTGWFVESVASEILVIFAIRTRRFFLKSRPSRLLFSLSVGAVIVAVLLIYSPFGLLFKFQPPPFWVLIIIGLLIIIYLSIVEIFKRIYYKKVNI